LSTFPDGLYQFGGSPVGPAPSVIAAGGTWYWVDPANGNDNNSGLKPTEPLKLLSAAEDKCTANKHDGVFIMGSATAITETASITWDKSYTHLIGLTAPTMFGIRNRVATSTATVNPLITISGNGCVFQNVMFSNEGSAATTAAVCAILSGSRNYFSNVTFRKLGALAVVDASKRDIKISSSDGENYFYRCTFGTDTYDGSADAANYVMEFVASSETARNVFDECWWLGSGSAGASFITAGASSLSSFQLFKNCIFTNNDHGTMNAMTQAFAINESCGGHLIMHNCLSYGATNLETSDSNMIITNPASAAATGIVGVVATT